MTESSMGGPVYLNYAPSGLSWRLACPAVNALESGNVGQIFSDEGATSRRFLRG